MSDDETIAELLSQVAAYEEVLATRREHADRADERYEALAEAHRLLLRALDAATERAERAERERDRAVRLHTDEEGRAWQLETRLDALRTEVAALRDLREAVVDLRRYVDGTSPMRRDMTAAPAVHRAWAALEALAPTCLDATPTSDASDLPIPGPDCRDGEHVPGCRQHRPSCGWLGCDVDPSYADTEESVCASCGGSRWEPTVPGTEPTGRPCPDCTPPEASDDEAPQHLHTCGTAYRGCDPGCPFDAYWRERDAESEET